MDTSKWIQWQILTPFTFRFIQHFKFYDKCKCVWSKQTDLKTNELLDAWINRLTVTIQWQWQDGDSSQNPPKMTAKEISNIATCRILKTVITHYHLNLSDHYHQFSTPLQLGSHIYRLKQNFRSYLFARTLLHALPDYEKCQIGLETKLIKGHHSVALSFGKYVCVWECVVLVVMIARDVPVQV